MRMRVLITVKTYPTLSSKYDELVCTAGFNENGEWIRLYPIPYRKLDFANQYNKYDWIELDVMRNNEDPRPESYRPTNVDDIQKIGHLDTENGKWTQRKSIVFRKVFTSMADLIAEAKNRDISTSLAVFKPTKILDFKWEVEEETEWSADKLAVLQQQNIFEQEGASFNPVRKLPYKFKYVFESASGQTHSMMIEDWEIGALYWNGFKKFCNGEKACEYVREKYFDTFTNKHDLHFFLGTTRQFHFMAPNPFIIIGTFHPLLQYQTDLFGGD